MSHNALNHDFALTVYAPLVARWINTGSIDLNKVQSKEDFAELVSRMGRTTDDAFEIHVDRISDRISVVKRCLDDGFLESAILVLFTAIEGEVNSALRIMLRIRNFPHGVIDAAIGGIDLKTKLDLIFPLLGIKSDERFKQFTRQSQIVRNLEVHFRAVPEQWADSGNVKGSCDSIREKASEFFMSNPIERVEQDISNFVDDCVNEMPEVKKAIELMSRYINK